jgi:hypothetical protein
MINKRLICISGFSQSMAKPNGIEKVWLDLRVHESPSCRVSYKEWDTPWTDFAEHIIRTGPTNPNDMDICVFAYSWGCGHGALTLLEELKHRGVKVRAAVFADPVYHRWFAPWRALWSPFVEPVICVHDNLGELWYYRQEENKPSGHRVVREDENFTTVIHGPVILSRTHEFMDEDPLFSAKCMEVANGPADTDTRGNR